MEIPGEEIKASVTRDSGTITEWKFGVIPVKIIEQYSLTGMIAEYKVDGKLYRSPVTMFTNDFKNDGIEISIVGMKEVEYNK